MKSSLLNSIGKTAPILVFLTLLSLTAQTQDRIIKTSGDTIYCKISKIDSTRISFTIKKNDVEVNSSLLRTEIADYKYQYKYTTSSKYKIDSLKTLGILLVYKKKNGKPVKIIKNDGMTLTLAALKPILITDKEAYALYDEARKKHKTALLFAKCGGAFIGFGLGSLIAGAAGGATPEANAENAITAGVLGGLGIASIGISFTMLPKANQKLFEALKIRNGK
jgi:hypothetical protein